MLPVRLILTLSWALAVNFVTATSSVPADYIRVRNAPGTGVEDTLSAIRRSLVSLGSQRRDTILKNTTSLQKSWNNATLFSLEGEVSSAGNVSVTAGVDITCTTCYINGAATVEFSIDGDFNASQAIANFTEEIGGEIKNLTEAAVDYVGEYFTDVVKNLADGFDLDDFDFPTLNYSFNLDFSDIPQCRLQFSFDQMELYMLMDTVLSAGATYKLSLYSSNSPIGISVSSDMFLGVIFAVDLILSADAEIDISSGLHIKVEDGLALDIPLFSQNVSSITFNGASFEFLPVTVQSAGGVINAVLRLGLHAGVEVASPAIPLPGIGLSTRASAGIEVGVFADLAEFGTNITVSPEGGDDDADCALRLQQTYRLGLAAAAGASLAIGQQTWGPAPSTQIPIFYTTLADICAANATRTSISTITTATATANATITARADDDSTAAALSTTTLTQKTTFTGVACASPGLVNCPASLQSTTKITRTSTVVTAVPSGAVAFPAAVQSTVASVVPFGTAARSIAATSGSPVSYVPPPPSSATTTTATTATTDAPLGTVGGVDARLVIGLSVGLGVPVLAGVVAGAYFCLRRRRGGGSSRTAAKSRPQLLGTPQSSSYRGSFGAPGGKTTVWWWWWSWWWLGGGPRSPSSTIWCDHLGLLQHLSSPMGLSDESVRNAAAIAAAAAATMRCSAHLDASDGPGNLRSRNYGSRAEA
ncbi:hypothetical protein F5X96DRAFT_670208 [Biscogniauxia mediterranea]|nr:hypothetical protein F5X96DRAFT_670208 [Biscogniauxia mediterranea]